MISVEVEMEGEKYLLPNMAYFQYQPILSAIWDAVLVVIKPIIDKYPSLDMMLRLQCERLQLIYVSGDVPRVEINGVIKSNSHKLLY